MTKIQTIYFPDDTLLNEIDKIRWRDHKSRSQIVNIALEEYVKHHKDGNEQYTLDQPVLATPAFFRDVEVWRKYFEKLPAKEQDEHMFKIQEINGCFKGRFGVSAI